MSKPVGDAESVHEVLTGENQIYERSTSILLTEANRNQIIEAFVGLVEDSPSLVTLFFAGHGFKYRSDYYLCTGDHTDSSPSLADVSISEIINLAQDNNVKELNLVIDACESGSSIHSFREIVADQSQEKLGLMRLCIFSACLSEELAVEDEMGGVLTQLLVKTIKGEMTGLPINKPGISLFDVCDTLYSSFEGKNQTPIVSGINVLGHPVFCMNPNYAEGRDKDVMLHSDILHTVNVDLDEKAMRGVHSLKESLHKGIRNNYLELITSTRSIISSQSPAFTDVEGLLRMLSVTFRGKSDPCYWGDDLYISLSFILAVAPLIEDSDACARIVENLLVEAFQRELEILRYDESSWLSELGIADLENTFTECYYLPIRITKFLGRLGFLGIINQSFAVIPESEYDEIVDQIIEKLLSIHHSAFVMVNEVQAPDLALFFDYASNGEVISLERLFGLFLCDYMLTQGRVLSDNVPPRKIADYIYSRGKSWDESDNYKLYPDNVLPVFLVFAKRLSIEETLDPYLIELDKTTVNFFTEFAWESIVKDVISDGVNETCVLGDDFFTCEEFDEIIKEKLCFERGLRTCLLGASSHLFRNRLHISKSIPLEDFL